MMIVTKTRFYELFETVYELLTLLPHEILK